jgi:ankyrin repeat protein
MSHLPLRANLDWLKKTCKDRLALLRASDPAAKLSAAQLALAREYGFPSWRKLKAHVEQLREQLDLAPKADPSEPPAAPDDPDLARLLTAVWAADHEAVARLLEQRPILARSHGANGQTALHAAATCDNAQAALLLLACGADPDARFGQSGHTALSWALTCNSMNFARAIVRLGVKPDLFSAAGMGLLEQVQAFFDEDGNLRPNASQTGSSRFAADGSRLPCPPATATEQISDALYFASRNGQIEVVRFLLGKQPDLSFRGYLGGTALHWAHYAGARAVIELLEKAGADPEARDLVHRCTPRGFGICVPANWSADVPAMVDKIRARLAEDPALANLLDGGTRPLHEAARAGSVEAVQVLLDAGADPSLRNQDGKTAGEIAAERGHAAVTDLLRERAAGAADTVR